MQEVPPVLTLLLWGTAVQCLSKVTGEEGSSMQVQGLGFRGCQLGPTRGNGSQWIGRFSD